MAKKKVYAKKQEEPDGTFGYWIMTSFGILMPASLPADMAAKCPVGTLQVRARDAAHLDHFREHWCPELQETILTPKMDYDCRALVSAEDLARAVAKMTLAVSARKFKPTTNGPDGLKSKAKADALHSCYLKIWGAVTSLSDKKWAPVGTHTVISKKDANASAEICQNEGHCFPTGTKGGKVRVVHCSDCDALKNTSTGNIHYPKNHVAWTPPVPDATRDPFHVGSAL